MIQSYSSGIPPTTTGSGVSRAVYDLQMIGFAAVPLEVLRSRRAEIEAAFRRLSLGRPILCRSIVSCDGPPFALLFEDATLGGRVKRLRNGRTVCASITPTGVVTIGTLPGMRRVSNRTSQIAELLAVASGS